METLESTMFFSHINRTDSTWTYDATGLQILSRTIFQYRNGRCQREITSSDAQKVIITYHYRKGGKVLSARMRGKEIARAHFNTEGAPLSKRLFYFKGGGEWTHMEWNAQVLARLAKGRSNVDGTVVIECFTFVPCGQ